MFLNYKIRTDNNIIIFHMSLSVGIIILKLSVLVSEIKKKTYQSLGLASPVSSFKNKKKGQKKKLAMFHTPWCDLRIGG